MRNSDVNFACEPRSELILACFAKNAADRNFSNFAFYASEVLTLVRNANYVMRFTHVCTSPGSIPGRGIIFVKPHLSLAKHFLNIEFKIINTTTLS